jgi:hypothetical protein
MQWFSSAVYFLVSNESSLTRPGPEPQDSLFYKQAIKRESNFVRVYFMKAYRQVEVCPTLGKDMWSVSPSGRFVPAGQRKPVPTE